MSKMLANLKIGKKLTLLVGSGIGPIVCLGALSLWALGAISSAVDQEQAEADKMMSAQRVASDLGRVNSIVGHIAMSRQCALCHGAGSGGDRANQAALAKECQSLLSELKAGEHTPEGQKLVGELDKTGSSWLATNVHVLELGQAGKTAQAAALYREESSPAAGPVDQALRSYLNWQQPRLAESKERASALKRRMPIPVAILSLLALAISMLLGLAVTRGITKPLTVAVTRLDEVARGDVSGDVESEYLDRADEIGLLSKASAMRQPACGMPICVCRRARRRARI